MAVPRRGTFLSFIILTLAWYGNKFARMLHVTLMSDVSETVMIILCVNLVFAVVIGALKFTIAFVNNYILGVAVTISAIVYAFMEAALALLIMLESDIFGSSFVVDLQVLSALVAFQDVPFCAGFLLSRSDMTTKKSKESNEKEEEKEELKKEEPKKEEPKKEKVVVKDKEKKA